MVDVATLVRATFFGVQMGMVLILIAAGLTLIFGMLDVINVAHGSLYMLGAYVGLATIDHTGSFWLALVVAPLVVAGVSLAIEVLTLRPLYGRHPLYHILLTFGLLIVIEEVVLLIWGGQTHRYLPPGEVSGSLSIAGITYPGYRVFLLVFSTIVVALIWLALTRTNYGILMQASAHDSEMVEALGIDVWKVFTLVFVAGGALAGLAGVLLGADRGFQPTTGVRVIIEAFAIVVIGGLGSFRGAVAGALLVGLMMSYMSLISPVLSELSVFVLMALVLLIKPTGLFGTSEAM